MFREGEVHPRWVLRRDGRSAGRYSGNKVVRWIARPTLVKGRVDGIAVAPANAGNGSIVAGERPRIGGFGPLRVVSDN